MWAFLLQAVSSQPDATGLACFPTQALLWGQIERLRRCSIPESLIEYDGQVYGGELVVRYGNIDYHAYVGGNNTDFPEILNWPVAEGSYFTERDEDAATTVRIEARS